VLAFRYQCEIKKNRRTNIEETENQGISTRRGGCKQRLEGVTSRTECEKGGEGPRADNMKKKVGGAWSPRGTGAPWNKGSKAIWNAGFSEKKGAGLIAQTRC